MVPPDFSHFRGKLIFWPIRNTERDILFLLRALYDGVVPILIPYNIPTGKFEELKRTYPGFGELLGDGALQRGLEECRPGGQHQDPGKETVVAMPEGHHQVWRLSSCARLTFHNGGSIRAKLGTESETIL